MDETVRRSLEAAGIDAADALDRFLGNEELLRKFLRRFPQDGNMDRLRQALAAGDAEAAFTAAHTLKGVAGNLSLRTLYDRLCPAVEALRTGDLNTAAAAMPSLEAAYQQVLHALTTLD